MKYLTLCLLSLAVLGCGSKDAKPVTSPGAESNESTSGGEVADAGRCVPEGAGYEVTEYDTSGDNTPDVRKLFQTMGEGSVARLVLVCREADLNGDGRKDIVRLYTEEGRPQREEVDRDFDGRIDTRFEGEQAVPLPGPIDAPPSLPELGCGRFDDFWSR